MREAKFDHTQNVRFRNYPNIVGTVERAGSLRDHRYSTVTYWLTARNGKRYFVLETELELEPI